LLKFAKEEKEKRENELQLLSHEFALDIAMTKKLLGTQCLDIHINSLLAYLKKLSVYHRRCMSCFSKAEISACSESLISSKKLVKIMSLLEHGKVYQDLNLENPQKKLVKIMSPDTPFRVLGDV
jgi:hypothetical protein